jgi:hypothetical protein
MSKEEKIQELEDSRFEWSRKAVEAQNRASALEDQLTQRAAQLAEVQQANRTLASQKATAVEDMCDNVARAVSNYGEEHGSCFDGMVSFLAEAIGCSTGEAETRLRGFMSREITVTIYCTVLGAEHDHITESEAQSFIAEALGTDEVEGLHLEISGIG